MAQSTEGFQEDNIRDFLRHISENIPHFTNDKLLLLLDYLNSVGATCEAELYKINEKDLGEHVGAMEAKLIMQYLTANVQPGAPSRIAKSTEVDGEKQQSEEQRQGADASLATGVQPRIELNCKELTTMFKEFLQLQASEGHKNRQHMEQMVASSVDRVSQEMEKTVKNMGSMMTEQLNLQKELIKKIDERTSSLEKKLLESQAAQREEWLKHIQDLQSTSQAQQKEWLESALTPQKKALQGITETIHDISSSTKKNTEELSKIWRCSIQ